MTMSFLTASEISREYQSSRRSVSQVVKYYLERIGKLDPRLRAYLKVEIRDPEEAQKRVEPKKKGKLYGIPIAIKDNICVEGWEITCASKILKGYISPYNATVIERLVEEGAVLLGRTNMDEFAFGSSCENSAYGPTHNPWDLSCAPGGSSGGSAAAVAADLAVMALGSDTGGSIRQPASFCGIVGVKPTYGRVSRYGLVAFASSLDQIGPITRSVEDAARLLEVIAGFDRRDSTSADIEVPEYSKVVGESIRGIRVGVPKEFCGEGLPQETKKFIGKAQETLAGLGAEVLDISLPHTDYAVSVYYVIAPSEASSNLARFDGVRYGARAKNPQNMLDLYTRTRENGFGPESKRRIILGTYALSSGYYDAFYLKAMKVRKKMIEDFNEAFKKVDVILTPTSPGAAFKLGERTADPLSMYLSDIFTISANLAGVPAIAVPCGVDSQGMPLGIQFMARPFDEVSLFKVAHAYEEKTGTRKLHPSL